jgi:hypothetical protein
MIDLVNQLNPLRDPRSECRDQAVLAWQATLHALFDRIEMWIAPGVEAGLFAFGREQTTFDEEGLGTYQAPTFWIRALRSTVWFEADTARPGWATMMNGHSSLVRGRARITCGTLRYALYPDDAGRWLLRRRHHQPRLLSEELLADVLQELLPDRKPPS